MRFLIIALLLVPTFCFAQNCNFSSNRIDDFTGEVVKETRAKKLEFVLVNHYRCEDCSFSARVGFRRDADNVMLRLDLMAPAVFSIKKGGLIQLKFEDDDILESYSLSYEIAEYKEINGLESTPWRASVYFLLNEELVNKLSSTELSKARIHFTDGYGSSLVRNSKSAKKIQDYLSCVLE